MSFFDKLKQGVNDAGQKAKTAVELTRLKSQVQAVQKQIEEKQATIGGMVYQQYEAGDVTVIPAAVEVVCQEIAQLYAEIRQLDVKLKEMNNEKECECGKVVPLDTRFCPFCGHAFAKQPEIIEVKLQEAPTEEQVGTSTEAGMRPEAEKKGP